MAKRARDDELEHASQCWLPTEFTPLKLVAKCEYNHDSTLYDFELPRCTSLNLPACACVLLRAPGRGANGEDVVRPYTPISDNAMLGRFQILVKRYDGGAASQWLHGLDVGAAVEFKHIKFNVKRQYPFAPAKTISLLCAGTGIAPAYQALMKLMNTPTDDRKVVLLYGNKSEKDILLRAELEGWARRHPDRLKVVHVVGATADAALPAGFGSTDAFVAEAGWIDEEKVRRHCFAPAADTAVFVCGLPVMYDLWCGPRGEQELKPGTLLARLGYKTEMVSKL